jgi:hypothetical protein
MDGLGIPDVWGLTPYGALVGMVVVLFLSLARGWLIPKSSHERELSVANKRGDEWKETAEVRGKLIMEQSAQITTLVEATRTSAAFFGTVDKGGGGKRVEEAN